MVNEKVLLHDLKLLASNFYKVIEVNLEEDTYFQVKVDGAESRVYKSLRKWMEAAIEAGYIYKEDIADFRKFFDLIYEKDFDWKRVYYRRRIDNEWRMVCMEIVMMDKDDSIALLVVRDVEGYIKDYHEQITLSGRDSLLGR